MLQVTGTDLSPATIKIFTSFVAVRNSLSKLHFFGFFSCTPPDRLSCSHVIRVSAAVFSILPLFNVRLLYFSTLTFFLFSMSIEIWFMTYAMNLWRKYRQKTMWWQKQWQGLRQTDGSLWWGGDLSNFRNGQYSVYHLWQCQRGVVIPKVGTIDNCILSMVGFALFWKLEISL